MSRRLSEENEQLQGELKRLRTFILESTAPPLPDLLQAYAGDPRHADAASKYSLRAEFVDLVLDAGDALAEQHPALETRRALCPLCHQSPSSEPDGFTVPTGLERHLLGTGQQKCTVIDVVEEAALQRSSKRQVPIASVEAAEVIDLVRPHVAQKLVGERAVTLWEIRSSRDAEPSPLVRALRVPNSVKWIWGTEEEAEYVGKRWVQSLRWKGVTIDTRLWIRWSRDHWIVTLDNPSETPQQVKPRWDGRAWGNHEPAIIEERPSWRAEEMVMNAARESQKAWDARKAQESKAPLV